MSSRLLLPLTVALLATGPASFAAEPKIEETVVGPANAGGVYTISQRGAHITFASTKGSRLAVIADGVEGPLFDELFNPFGASFFSPQVPSVSLATSGGMQANTVSAVIVSANGEHYAYAGRQGAEYVVIHDGKEIGRGPRQSLALNYGKLTISPGGKFVYWGEMTQPTSGNATWRLVINGKQGPWCGHHNWEPVFSPDDTRYAYNTVSVEDKEKRGLVIDGKVAGYYGYAPMFTADSKVLLTQAPGNALLVDGKPVSIEGTGVEKIVVAPVGRRYAAIVRRKTVNYQGVGVLYLDGKEVAGTEGAQNISFSPDGKRYALSCINAEARSAFMIIDGKKGAEYQSVADSKNVAWTPDSSKVVYTASTGGRQFVIADGQEFPVPGLNMRGDSPIVTSQKGNRYALSTYDGSNRIFSVIVDGQPALPPNLWPQAVTLTFSADGSRYAYVVNPVGRNEIAGLVVDGKLSNDLAVGSFNVGGGNAMNITGVNPEKNPYFQFSRDGKYLTRMARLPNNTKAGLYVNEKLAYPTTLGVFYPTYTPDSKHLFWLAAEKFPDRPNLYYVVYADGQPLMKLDADYFLATGGHWEMGTDNVLTFLAKVGDNIKRFRVTPAVDMDIDRMVADAETKQAKAEADAAAAKLKAEEEAAAAKAKAAEEKAAAAAKAKADYDAAVAKKKADAAAAAAAKAKARADAAAAKKK